MGTGGNEEQGLVVVWDGALALVCWPVLQECEGSFSSLKRSKGRGSRPVLNGSTMFIKLLRNFQMRGCGLPCEVVSSPAPEEYKTGLQHLGSSG